MKDYHAGVRLDAEDVVWFKALAQTIGASFNSLIREAVTKYRRDYERAAIDKDFEGMATDVCYLQETDALLEDFKYADAEASR